MAARTTAVSVGELVLPPHSGPPGLRKAARRYVQALPRCASTKPPIVFSHGRVPVVMNDCSGDVQPRQGPSGRLAALEKFDRRDWVGIDLSPTDSAVVRAPFRRQVCLSDRCATCSGHSPRRSLGDCPLQIGCGTAPLLVDGATG